MRGGEGEDEDQDVFVCEDTNKRGWWEDTQPPPSGPVGPAALAYQGQTVTGWGEGWGLPGVSGCLIRRVVTDGVRRGLTLALTRDIVERAQRLSPADRLDLPASPAASYHSSASLAVCW